MIVEPKREILLGPLLRAGVRRSWAARDHFLRLAIVPLAAMITIVVPLERVGLEVLNQMQSNRMPEDAGPAAQSALLSLAYGAVLAVFAVNWLRQLTLGMSAAPGLGLALSARHLRFFLLILAISFGTFIMAFVLVLILSVFGSAGTVAALMASPLIWAALIARTSPSWIGVALDAPMPLRVAWRRTSGQGFKLLVALLAIEVPLMVVHQLIQTLFAVTGLLVAAPLTFFLVTAAIQLIGTAAQLAILVTAFPHFLRETV